MPCSYFIDTESKFVELTSYGKVTKDEVMQRLKRMLNDPDWVPGYPVISDYSLADIRHVTSSDLDEVLSLAIELREKMASSQFAFVVSSDLHYALLRMWAMKGGENIIDIKCFKSRTAALSYLNQSEVRQAVAAQ